MALLNENRNRIPQTEVLPVTGDDGGLRGQMRMLDTTGSDIAVCTVSDEDTFSELTVPMAAGSVLYLSVPIGDAGAAITVEHAVGGNNTPDVTVTDNQILVTGDAATTGAQVVTAIENNAAASALVIATDSGSTTLVVAAEAQLVGGNGTRATATILTSLVVTAASSGSAGNDITIEVVDVLGTANVSATVSDNAITIVGDSNIHTTAQIATAITTNANTNAVITAVGGGDALATTAATPLVGGASLAVWGTLTVA